MSTNPEKRFKHFDELLPEIRMMMINKMLPDDRARFMRSSKFSRWEAMKSKNYIYGLEFNDLSDGEIRIHVILNEGRDENNKGYGFIFHYKIEKETKYVIYTDMANKEFWRVELISTTELVLFAAEHFKKVLKNLQNKIRKLVIFHWPEFHDGLQDFDYEIESLNRVEWLETRMNTNILPFVSKLRRPLKAMAVIEKKNNQRIENYDFSTVQNYLCVPHIKLNYEQFLQLPALKIRLHIGYLTEDDICNYVQLWQSGRTGKEVETYKWELEGSTFDLQKLFNFFGKEIVNSGDYVDIQHNLVKGREALLFYEDGHLHFDTDERNWMDGSEMGEVVQLIRRRRRNRNRRVLRNRRRRQRRMRNVVHN